MALVTLISLPIVIMVPDGLAGIFLTGAALVPQPLLWTRAFDRQRSGHGMKAYVLANQITVIAIVCLAAYVRMQ